jgi:hypothetical protein
MNKDDRAGFIVDVENLTDNDLFSITAILIAKSAERFRQKYCDPFSDLTNKSIEL